MRFFIYTGLCTLPFLSGCLGMEVLQNSIDNHVIQKYQEPNTGDVAYLRAFFSDAEKIRIYPNSTTISQIKHDQQAGSIATERYISGWNSVDYKEKKLGMPFLPQQSSFFAEYKVPANQSMLVSLFYTSSDLKGNYNITSTCPKRYYLVQFEQNKNYGAQVHMLNKRCMYRIFEYQADGSEKLLKNIKRVQD